MAEQENIITYFCDLMKTMIHADNSHHNIADKLALNMIHTMQMARRIKYIPDELSFLDTTAFAFSNRHSDNRIETIHYYLDLLRKKNSYDGGNALYKNALYNIIRTMRMARNDKICGEDLSDLDFGSIPFNGIYWTVDTLTPSDFTGSSLNEWNFMSGHRDRIILVKESPNCKFIVSCGVDGAIVVWEKESCLVHKLIATVDSKIIDASFLSDYNSLYLIALLDNGYVVK